MESLTLLLILVGVVVLVRVLAARWRKSRVYADKYTKPTTSARNENAGAIPKSTEPLEAELAKLTQTIKSDTATAEIPAMEIETDGMQASTNSPGSVERQPNLSKSAASPDRIIVLSIVAPEAQPFDGPAILNAVERAGLRYGDMRIFHYFPAGSPGATPLFSLANMLKPGDFDLEQMRDFRTAGLSLFMIPDGRGEDVDRFELMLTTVKRIALDLGGEVRDARRSVLTRQAIDLMRESIIEWNCKAKAVR